MFYHSGATEGINSFFKGAALELFKEKKTGSFFLSVVDHAAVVELKEDLLSLGHHVHFFNVNKDGDFNIEELIQTIKEETKLGRVPFLNYTYLNNETGVIWPLSLAEKIKSETAAFIHVDAVQLVGKIANWNELSPSLDAYTFSGHKFGSMKGVGFSFLSKSLKLSPLLVGGNQQSGLRAGTENAAGIYSLKLALEDLKAQFNASETAEAKNYIEKKLVEFIGERGEIVGRNNKFRNLNTIFLVLYGQAAELVSARFDMAGMDVSTGSACSSGIIKENRILKSMGYSESDSKSAVRFSFSPTMNLDEAKTYWEKIQHVLSDILKIK